MSCLSTRICNFVAYFQTIQSTRRKVVQYQPYQDDSAEYHDHGTHVVGTVLGRRSSDGIVTDEVGMIDGVARDAKVAFFDIGAGSSKYII